MVEKYTKSQDQIDYENQGDDDEDIKKVKAPKFDYFTPCFDSMLKDYGPITSAVWGKLWRGAQTFGHSFISQETMAEELHLSKNTICFQIKKLIELDYLIEKDWPEENEKSSLPGYLKKIDKRVILYIPNAMLYEENYPNAMDSKKKNEFIPLSQEEIKAIIIVNSKKQHKYLDEAQKLIQANGINDTSKEVEQYKQNKKQYKQMKRSYKQTQKIIQDGDINNTSTTPLNDDLLVSNIVSNIESKKEDKTENSIENNKEIKRESRIGNSGKPELLTHTCEPSDSWGKPNVEFDNKIDLDSLSLEQINKYHRKQMFGKDALFITNYLIENKLDITEYM